MAVRSTITVARVTFLGYLLALIPFDWALPASGTQQGWHDKLARPLWSKFARCIESGLRSLTSRRLRYVHHQLFNLLAGNLAESSTA
jgi:hypothetical protein